MIDTVKLSVERGTLDAKLGKTPSPPIIYSEEKEAYFAAYWEIRAQFFYSGDYIRIS